MDIVQALVGPALLMATTTGADGRQLDTPAARRQHVLAAAVHYASGVETVVAVLTKQGRGKEARRLKEHAAQVRLGWNIPHAVRGLKGVRFEGRLKNVWKQFARERDRALAACDRAAKMAQAAGDLNRMQRLVAEREALRTMDKMKLAHWSDRLPATTSLRWGRVIERVPRLFEPNERRFPNQLATGFGPRRFRIEGTCSVETVQFEGRERGHIGRMVVIDRPIDASQSELTGVLRVKEPIRPGHTNYQVGFVKGRRILFSPKLADVKPGVTYDWSCRWESEAVTFELTDNGRPLLTREIKSAGAVRIAFASTVRHRGDRASLIVAFR